jgi:hypothetical protein
MTDLKALFDAIARSIDEKKLERELHALTGAAASGGEGAPSAKAAPSSARFLLQDILDESILGAKAGDKSYPLRVLLSELAAKSETDSAFVLLCALNVYFRVEADDEVKQRLGFEISRLFYGFMEEARPEGLLARDAAGLVAALLSTELQRVRLEAVDHLTTFDSAVHERAQGSDASSAHVKRPASFLCRVPQTGMVRMKALVVT